MKIIKKKYLHNKHDLCNATKSFSMISIPVCSAFSDLQKKYDIRIASKRVSRI